jgi:thymidine phosphorylase
VRGEVKMTLARTAAGDAMAAARDLRGAARHAAYAAGQAGVVPHVAAHELGAAAYAIKAARAGAPEGEDDRAGRVECRWQRE